MKTKQCSVGATLAIRREEIRDAFRAWHRGDSLTERQLDLIDEGRIQCLARAYGVAL